MAKGDNRGFTRNTTEQTAVDKFLREMTPTTTQIPEENEIEKYIEEMLKKIKIGTMINPDEIDYIANLINNISNKINEQTIQISANEKLRLIKIRADLINLKTRTEKMPRLPRKK